MKTAICYYSRHHGNTLKVLEDMAEAAEIDLIDVTSRMAARLPQYDRIGFASGIYYSKFHDTVVHYAAQYLPEGKETFFVCTQGPCLYPGPVKAEKHRQFAPCPAELAAGLFFFYTAYTAY